jgi:hypothetical protein
LLITVCHSEVGLVVSLNTFNHSGLHRRLRYFFFELVSFPG